ncbi:hypothetical protein [Rhizobium sp. BK176]|uniref:hypothetical protein n=1 Tax=Rhizobium sp. BK176 TaxID=2587071 RepID=UPI0021678C50|nr:hypothetical protein [Rhizobium sp. BK176]MCS4089417.1 hypothetical protein [Rhizobium sp. BK176]
MSTLKLFFEFYWSQRRFPRPNWRPTEIVEKYNAILDEFRVFLTAALVVDHRDHAIERIQGILVGVEIASADILARLLVTAVRAVDLADQKGRGVVEVLRLVGQRKGGAFPFLGRDGQDDRPDVPVLIGLDLGQTAFPLRDT